MKLGKLWRLDAIHQRSILPDFAIRAGHADVVGQQLLEGWIGTQPIVFIVHSSGIGRDWAGLKAYRGRKEGPGLDRGESAYFSGYAITARWRPAGRFCGSRQDKPWPTAAKRLSEALSAR